MHVQRQTDARICLNHRTLLHTAGGDDLCWPHHCLRRLLGPPGLVVLAALQAAASSHPSTSQLLCMGPRSSSC